MPYLQILISHIVTSASQAFSKKTKEENAQSIK